MIRSQKPHVVCTGNAKTAIIGALIKPIMISGQYDLGRVGAFTFINLSSM
jgi:hypothetical protein